MLEIDSGDGLHTQLCEQSKNLELWTLKNNYKSYGDLHLKTIREI